MRSLPGERPGEGDLHRPLSRPTAVGDHAGVTAAPPPTSTVPTRPAGRGSTAPSRRSRPTPTAAPTPTCWSTRCRRSGASTSTSRTSRPIPTGSLKHRLARSLFLYGAVLRADHRGQHRRGGLQRVARRSARPTSPGMLGLPFVAVMPATTSPEKIALIEFHGGRCHLVDDARRRLRRGAAARGRVRRPLPRPVHLRRAGHRLAGQQQHRRVDLRAAGPRAAPGARVGGRRRGHRRHQRDDRPLPALPAAAHPAGRRRPGGLVVLPRLAGRRPGDGDRAAARGSRASAGPRVEPSFVPTIVDRMICVPDAASLAAMRRAGAGDRPAGRRVHRHQPVGRLPAGRRDARRRPAAAASSRCCATAASGTPTPTTPTSWVAAQGLDLAPHTATLRRFAATGEWAAPA